MTQQLTQLMPLSDYRDARQHIFPSKGSLDWFVRQQRAGLVRAQALLLVAGRWRADADKFDTYVIEAGTRAAQRAEVASS